ncbi:MAG: UDP-N-acetylmuramoyl-tripeptide--D-alanyl-D-alanine ligase [Bacteroidales bacterium]
MEISELHSLFLRTSGVCIDTRNLLPSCMFFALKGENFNGNSYAQLALKKGASYVIVDEDILLPNSDRIVKVESVLCALQKMAKYHRQQLHIPIFGITGTNGKTTTKELLSLVISKKYSVTTTKGNFNNHIGVPLTLLSMTTETKFGIVEMGANHLGEIQFLCEIAQPNAGLITNVGKAHLEGFGSFEGVKKTKGELYDYLTKNNGQIFASLDSPDLQEMLRENKATGVIEYGLQKDNVRLEIDEESGILLNLRLGNGDCWKTQLVGDYNAQNILAAVAIGRYFGIEDKKIKDAIEQYIPTNARSQRIKTQHNTIILDAYNANPTSMSLAIQNFSKIPIVNKTLILGDMLELGKETQLEHENVLRLTKEKGLERVLLVGDIFCTLASENSYLTFKNTMELTAYLEKYPLLHQTVFIKGSRGIGLEKILSVL